MNLLRQDPFEMMARLVANDPSRAPRLVPVRVRSEDRREAELRYRERLYAEGSITALLYRD